MHPDFVEVSAIYQQFCDRNIELKKREDELQLNINKLETKTESQKPRLNECQPWLQESNMDNNENLNLEVQQEEVNERNVTKYGNQLSSR